MHSRHGIGRTTKLVTVVAALATTIGVVGVASAGAQAAPRLGALTALPGSLPRTTDHVIGNYRIGQMQVEVALAPRNARGLQNEIRHTYVKSSKTYHHWLSKGQFAKRYAPSVQVREAVARYLKSEGLRPVASGSAFLMRAVGSSAQVASTFHTTLSVYQDPRGDRYYSNSSVVRLPSSLTKGVLGVIGLTNTIRDHTNLARLPYGHSVGSSACQTGYVTAAELFNLVDNNVGFPYGYGGGPGCSGLTPSQTNGLYGAPGGTDTTGKGVTTAVFELSAYQQSDIAAWTNEFYGPGYKAPLQNVLVDGGPLAPICPAADLCPANYNGYSGDIEVDADIQMTLDVAPATKKLQVYEAPNDYSGQTELDLYTAIANQDTADTVSSSWGVCENDITAPYAQAENVIFEQMALQGQSMFNSAGDTGAFGCLRSDGTTIVDAEDPATQPWVTSVGGTSFTFDNPATNANPTYPNNGDEMVWNVDNLCNASANEGGFSGLLLVRRDRCGWRRHRASGGADPSTSSAPASRTRTRRSATARRSARSPRSARRAARAPTSRRTPTRTRATRSTAPPTPRPPTARAASAGRAVARVVRDRRHEPLDAAVGRAHRGPRRPLRLPTGQHQRVRVPARDSAGRRRVLPRHHRCWPVHEQRWCVPDHAGLRHRDRARFARLRDVHHQAHLSPRRSPRGTASVPRGRW